MKPAPQRRRGSLGFRHVRLGMLLILLLLVATYALIRQARRPATPPVSTAAAMDPRRLAAELAALEAREQEIARTIWPKELLAQDCGHVFERFWNELNRHPNKWPIIAGFPFTELVLPMFGAADALPHGIGRANASGTSRSWAPAAWGRYVSALAEAGWSVTQTEFRHVRFEVDPAGRPGRSTFRFAAHLVRSQPPERAALRGDLIVHWLPSSPPSGPPQVGAIDASAVQLQQRAGPVPFVEALRTEVLPPPKSFFIDPLLVHDLDHDGRSEIVLVSANRVWRLGSDGRFTESPLCPHSPGVLFTAVLGDFDGDAFTDLLVARFGGLGLYRGNAQGEFPDPPRPAWAVVPRLKYGQVLTGGDVDGDGDLDVWLGQYKVPYEAGQMPTPYYAANDGDPSYLLLNDGQGHFRDATEAAGLGAKRWRRTYAASLVDLDQDQDLDLLVSSDFAGVDLYDNDGRGRYRDVTRERLPAPHAFGMAHTIADFDGDGTLDFLVLGMHCPTASRLHHLGLVRPERPDYAAMHPLMAAGNRLFNATPTGHFALTPLGQTLAQSGWSWGCATFDFDNDSHPDVYVANGHETKASVQDYEPQFWLHDIYVATSAPNPVTQAFFAAQYRRTRGQGYSYGGWEKNRLFWNQAGQAFLEVGHLAGLALEEDGRNVVSDDLDGDGRVDLIVTTFEAWPHVRQTLRVYLNRLENPGRWLQVQLASTRPSVSPVGAVVTLNAGGHRFVRPILTGDSHRSQHSAVAHFGLGTDLAPDRVEVRWPGGERSVLERPAANTRYVVRPP